MTLAYDPGEPQPSARVLCCRQLQLLLLRQPVGGHGGGREQGWGGALASILECLVKINVPSALVLLGVAFCCGGCPDVHGAELGPRRAWREQHVEVLSCHVTSFVSRTGLPLAAVQGCRCCVVGACCGPACGFGLAPQGLLRICPSLETVNLRVTGASGLGQAHQTRGHGRAWVSVTLLFPSRKGPCDKCM